MGPDLFERIDVDGGEERAIPRWKNISNRMAPAVGFEPTTWRLTAARSTTELRRSEGPPRAIAAAVGAARRKDSIRVRGTEAVRNGPDGVR